MAVANEQRVSRVVLAGDLDRVLDAVKSGETVLVERDGQPEAAVVDIVDYRLLRAVARYHAEEPEVDLEAGLTDEQADAVEGDQAHYDLVMAYYLRGSLSTGRTAQLLRMPWITMRDRFSRLSIPFFTGPSSLDELREEIRAAEGWLRGS